MLTPDLLAPVATVKGGVNTVTKSPGGSFLALSRSTEPCNP
jgi:hypothetical protein